MAKIRTIKPDFWEDEKIAELPYGARLLFISTWNFCDDNGLIKTTAKHIKAKAFPYDETLRENEVKKWIDALVKARMLVPISHAGESYYVVRTFRSHQIIDKRYTREILPLEVVEKLTAEALGDTSETHSEHIVITPSSRVGKEGKGKELEWKGSGEPPPVLEMPFLSGIFLKQWLLWKDFKAKEHKFFYKTPQSEQAALNDLVKKANGIEETAIEIIHQSMAGGWKGFFELKNSNNGQQQANGNGGKQTAASVSTASAFSKIDRMSD